ncbi:hypothetical protein [Parasutterella secunda]|uniref:Uncharacterized protein n=1 Tax=Parasutterella secunda TaxID=626947 RepID=A0ABS2GQV7_9BURK|nr:hypothetical protein [Parasutterella secunda]MBM6928150.1 hypothetical protein [Parasutterella secunda]
MTHVDWHPVKVNKYGKITEGKRPYEMTTVFVTNRDGGVDTDTYIDDADGFGDGHSNMYFVYITAWRI